MSQAVARTASHDVSQISPEIMEIVLAEGDLSRLTPQQRVTYYAKVCESQGLNPLTRPFDYMRLNGKLVLYAKRDYADQKRKIEGISIQIVDKRIEDDLYIVTAHAKNAAGKEDEDVGAVPIAGLKGEAKANAILKAVTKAKRRVTLSICGMGMLDETEIESIPGAARVDPDAHVISKPEPKPVRAARVDAPRPTPPERTSKTLSPAELNAATHGDDIPTEWPETPPSPPPESETEDRFLLVARKIIRSFDEVRDPEAMAAYEADPGVKRDREKIASVRPELDEQIERARAMAWDRLNRQDAPA